VLNFEGNLPTTSLLGNEEACLYRLMREHEFHWFRAGSDFVSLGAGPAGTFVSTWDSLAGDMVAKPSAPNIQNGRFSSGSPWGEMVFQAETNCGYSVNPIAPTAERFSVAVIYRSRNCDGRTLCSIAGKSHDNFIFANEFQGKLSIIDRAGTIGLTFQSVDTMHRPSLLVFSFDSGCLRATLNGGAVQEALGDVPSMGGLAELFIGCRNHRKKLAKTLGNLWISDLIYWPDKTIVSAEGAQMTAELSAVNEFWRWAR
jgi:hypothetical protein